MKINNFRVTLAIFRLKRQHWPVHTCKSYNPCRDVVERSFAQRRLCAERCPVAVESWSHPARCQSWGLQGWFEKVPDGPRWFRRSKDSPLLQIAHLGIVAPFATLTSTHPHVPCTSCHVLHCSDFVLADILLSSPKKLFIFVINKVMYRIKSSASVFKF